LESEGLRLHPGHNELLTERGIRLPLPGRSTRTPENRAEKGLAVQKEIIGSDAVEELYTSAPADEQHIHRYLSANCFGDHYTRTGIDVPTRELLTPSACLSRSADANRRSGAM
jgi:4-carboxymuconolactone decarboxylase